MNSTTILPCIWCFTTVANAFAAWRMYTFSLLTRYRSFQAFLLFGLCQVPLSMLFPGNSTTYLWIYTLTEPVGWLLSLMVIRELYGLILSEYSGIATVGRWAMYGSASLALLVTAAALLLTSTRAQTSRSMLLHYYEDIERSIMFSSAIFILLLIFFLSRYPLPLHRNVATHSIIFSVLYLSDALILLLDSVSRIKGFTGTMNLLLGVVTGCCYLAWGLLMTREGESSVMRLRSRASPGADARLLRELDSVNAVLLGLVRK